MWDKAGTEQAKVTVTESSQHLSLHLKDLDLAILVALAAAAVPPASSPICSSRVKDYDG